MNILIQIDQKWFEENKKNFHYIDKFDDLKKPQYQIQFSDNNHETMITEDGEIKISSYTENIAFVVVESEPDVKSLINLSAIISKYYNRAKTVFEALR